MEGRISINEVNGMDESGFVVRFGAVYESSPWIAGAAWKSRPFADLGGLHDAMARAVDAAPEGLRMGLIRAHPDLAGKAAMTGELTADSAGEQSSAGLDRLTPGEYEEFTRMNQDYRERFGMPMVVCVREHGGKDSILRAARERLGNPPEREVEVALGEIHKIARLRLEDLIEPEGTTEGRPSSRGGRR